MSHAGVLGVLLSEQRENAGTGLHRQEVGVQAGCEALMAGCPGEGSGVLGALV